MSQNPYSQFNAPGSQPYGGGVGGMGGDFIDPTPSRTSVLAITALVISIVGCIACVVPGPGAIAAIIGGLAIFFIARSQGRLTGTGIAVTAVVLGLFQTVAMIALLVGFSQMNSQIGKEFFVPMGNAMTAVEKGDVQGARAMLTPKASAVVTDQMLRDFVSNYHASAGSFQKMPESVYETITMAMQLGKSSKNQSRNGGSYRQRPGDTTFPLPAKFSNGTALVMVSLDPTLMGQTKSPDGSQQALLNLGVITLDGKEVWLIDPAEASKLVDYTRPPKRASSPGTSDINDAPGKTPDTDDPDADAKPAPKQPAAP